MPSVPHRDHVVLPVVVVAGGVTTGVTAGTGVTSYQHCLAVPKAGSPNTLLSQAMLLVAERVAYLVLVPYRTWRVPLNRHAPPSLAQSTQDDELAGAMADARPLAEAALLLSGLEDWPPPQALASAAAAIRLETR